MGPAWPQEAAPVVGAWEIIGNSARSGSFYPPNLPSREFNSYPHFTDGETGSTGKLQLAQDHMVSGKLGRDPHPA